MKNRKQFRFIETGRSQCWTERWFALIGGAFVGAVWMVVGLPAPRAATAQPPDDINGRLVAKQLDGLLMVIEAGVAREPEYNELYSDFLSVLQRYDRRIADGNLTQSLASVEIARANDRRIRCGQLPFSNSGLGNWQRRPRPGLQSKACPPEWLQKPVHASVQRKFNVRERSIC